MKGPPRDVGAGRNAGKENAARDLFDVYLPLIRFESQPGLGLAIRKYILAKRGAIVDPAVRAPGPKLSAKAVTEIDTLIHRLESKLSELGRPI